MSVLQPLFALSIVLTLYHIYRRWNRISVADIPGPEADSFLLGNQAEYYQSQAAETDFKWQARFGHVVRVHGILGTDRLLISDPKALHHIYTSGYNIRKTDFRSEVTRALTGPGLAWANDETHRRQRKLSAEWKETLGADSSLVVNVPRFFSRFFLDVIGEVAFDYQFGATEDANDPVAAALSSVVPNLFSPSKSAIFILGLLEQMPPWLIEGFMKYSPAKGLRNSRYVTRVAVGVARKLVDEKAEALLIGKGKRDIMSLLVKANVSANPRTNLSEAEMLAQMQTIMQAGHETTANTMSWTLFELTQHLDIQIKLRAEIKATQYTIHERGDTEFTAADLDSMPYTVAVMKEVLRFHPVAYNSLREAAREEILPLSKPIVTKSGKTITEIPIPKNQILVISNAGYNRNTDVFGQDAHIFNPERWLDGTVKPDANIGVYGNLMTFGSGHRACIGWRFAVYEYQAFLVELVKNFEFTMDPTLRLKVRREASIVMIPTIEGEVTKGSQLPITIRAVDSL
ncbi:cytochrome P450 [Mycena alexandri]|uniref:Cytochrome P450 n=1 Tax=Mycena alexandri TaxID=1745969 RepID=A0AAD6X621_9AGAR|nr:cytochrome P450 [Mycena alexandri]